MVGLQPCLLTIDGCLSVNSFIVAMSSASDRHRVTCYPNVIHLFSLFTSALQPLLGDLQGRMKITLSMQPVHLNIV